MFLGIDTSNYTTSVSLYDHGKGVVANEKQLLPVKEGEKGLRQSEAVFHHVQQLPTLFEQLPADQRDITAIGVSTAPRDVDGSYMPCFTVGKAFADSLAKFLKVPVYAFSHQAGHVTAALYSSGSLDWLDKRFLAFHFSGGTSEVLLCHPDPDTAFRVRLLFSSKDLKAGQVVDRVGVMLGLSFPCGPYLDALAQKSHRSFRIRPTFRGGDVCLSGVENQCRRMLDQGERPEDVAHYAISYIEAVVCHMTEEAKAQYGDLPVVYAGGVMSNSKIRASVSEKYQGRFAQPEFSSDNAAGVAILAAWRRDGHV